GDPFGQAASDPEHSQSGDEWNYPQSGDRQAVHQPDHSTYRDRRGKGQRGWPSALQRQGAGYAGKRDYRTWRKINASAHNDDGHANRTYGNNDCLRQNDSEVRQREKPAGTLAQGGKNRAHQKKRHERTKSLEPASHHVRARHRPGAMSVRMRFTRFHSRGAGGWRRCARASMVGGWCHSLSL